MKRSLLVLSLLTLLLPAGLYGQQFTGFGYWKLENDSVYLDLLQRQGKGETLSQQETTAVEDHRKRLSDYFSSMPDEEKASYYQNRSKWSAKPAKAQGLPYQEEDVFQGERSMYSQYLLSSGVFGFFYGLDAAYLLGMEGSGVMAVPLLTAGASTLVPMLSLKDKKVSYNSLKLSIHGKVAGAMHGAALGFLIAGDELDDGKLIFGLSMATSIAGGRIGYVLGRDKPWTQGRAALYSHYGFMMPLEGLALYSAFDGDNARLFALTTMAFGAGGYFLADAVADKYDYSRGDVTAVSTLAFTNAALGFCIVSDIENNTSASSSDALIPAVAAFGGTLIGQALVKDAHLTSQQGRNTALATTGGALIGLGLAAILTPDQAAPYYITAYATGLASYGIVLATYKKANRNISLKEDKPSRWQIDLAPQNIILNRKLTTLINSNPGKRISYLPAVSAVYRF